MLRIFKNTKYNKINALIRKTIKMRRLFLGIKQEEISEVLDIQLKQIKEYEEDPK